VTRRGERDDRGLVTTELVVVTPLLLAFLCLVVLVGRLVDARSDVIGAASDAARMASLQSSAEAARAQARLAASASVAGERLGCDQGGPTVETEFEPEFGRGATVHVIVTCTVNTSDLSYIGVPAHVTFVEHAWDTIDRYGSL
jgi:Flp pilus assembly protein TadG